MKVVKYDDGKLMLGSCLDHMKTMKDNSVDLVFGSPPYEDSRTYGIGFSLKGQDWVDWMVEIYVEALRVCKGLVAMVVGHGKTEGGIWTAVPALLATDLHRKGIILRNPPIYRRNGIMGGGGKDWLRPDYEWIICACKQPRLLWADNTACGHPPKYGPGGAPSHRDKSGTRLTDKQRQAINELVNKEGISAKQAGLLLGIGTKRNVRADGGSNLNTQESGAKISRGVYIAPEKANPGNVIDCGSVGSGKMGSNIAHHQEAPFPEKLPNFFIRSFCPPDGIVYDPFMGSGTTIAVAIKTGRKFLGSDVRDSQIKLTQRRIKQARLTKGFGL